MLQPRGRPTALNRSHPAARGAVFCGVSTGGSMVDIVARQNGTVSGAVSGVLDPIIGTATDVGASTKKVAFTGRPTAAYSNVTWAAVIRINAAPSTTHYICADGSAPGTNGSVLRFNTVAVNLRCNTDTLAISTALVSGGVYFIAGSAAVASSGNYSSMVVRRLDDASKAGEVLSAVGNATAAMTPNGTINCGLATINFLPADIAWVFKSQSTLSLKQLIAWAEDPLTIFDQSDELLSWASQSVGGIVGTASITEAGDTVSATGTIKIQGTANPTEGDDTLAGTGTVKLQAAASITEADDTSSATGTLKLQAAASITEGDDTSSAAGALKIQGALSATESDDTVVATGSGTASTTGTAAITEADDTVAATSTVKVQGAASVTEADDTASSTGTLKIQGAASPTEADDTVASAGTLRVQGAAAITEGDDTSAASATLKIVGTASITEAGDTVVATGGAQGILVFDPRGAIVGRDRRAVIVGRNRTSVILGRDRKSVIIGR